MAGTYSFSLVSESELGTLTKDSFPLQVTVSISRNESLEVCALLNLDAYNEPYFSNPYNYAFASFPETATNYGEVTLLITYDMVKDSLLEGDNFICLAMGYNPETIRVLITFTYVKSKELFIGAPYKKITLTNLCPAVDGANGFTIKSNSGIATGESSTTHIKYSEQSLKLNINDTSTSEVYAISTTTLPLNSEHIYYARIEAYQETKFGAVELYFPIAEPQMFNLAAGDVGKWNMYSVVKERSSFTAGDYTFRLDFNRERSAETTGSIWYDGWMIIDLTEAFGAGNEPEAVWCDENIPYAVGDFSIELPSDGTARKVKEMFIGVPLKLPNEYQQVKYLESTGNQWIDTGVPAFSKTRSEIDVKFTHMTGQGGYNFYNGHMRETKFASISHAFGSYYHGATDFTTLEWDTIDDGTQGWDYDYERHVLFLDGKTGEYGLLDGSFTGSGLIEDTEYLEGEYLYLFACNQYDRYGDWVGATYKTYEKVYGAKYYLDGVLVRDFIPCVRKSDNKPGMYDLINNQFYINQGTEEFLIGEKITSARKVKEAFMGINGIARKIFESVKLQSIYIVENTWPLGYEASTLEEVEQNFPYRYFKINAIYSDGSEKEVTNLTIPDIISSDEVIFSYAERGIVATVTANIDILLPPS